MERVGTSIATVALKADILRGCIVCPTRNKYQVSDSTHTKRSRRKYSRSRTRRIGNWIRSTKTVFLNTDILTKRADNKARNYSSFSVTWSALKCASKTTEKTTRSGLWFNIKMPSYQNRKSHRGDKTILRPSYLHIGISYTGKMTSLYWIRVQGATISSAVHPLNSQLEKCEPQVAWQSVQENIS